MPLLTVFSLIELHGRSRGMRLKIWMSEARSLVLRNNGAVLFECCLTVRTHTRQRRNWDILSSHESDTSDQGSLNPTWSRGVKIKWIYYLQRIVITCVISAVSLQNI